MNKKNSLHKVYTVIMAAVIIIFSSVGAFAQSQGREYYDSLFNKFKNLYPAENRTRGLDQVSSETSPVKCGFPVIGEVHANMENFTQEQQEYLEKAAQRITRHTSIVSPSGFFRIHFDTTGTQVPKYIPTLSPLENAQFVAAAFDSAYNYEVVFLGYPAPPADLGAGGDDLFDVYIMNIAAYGQTQFEEKISPSEERYTTYIEIENDYIGSFATDGVEAVNVTAAHEFHHAIQIGNYVYKDADIFFYELTSTSMEEFVYDSVNDYYAYMDGYFRNPGGKTFSRFGVGADGYDLAIWNIFLADSLDISIIKRQWELLPDMRAMIAINKSLEEYNTSFAEMFAEFGVWCFYTGYRALPGRYFEEAENYPLMKLLKPNSNFTTEIEAKAYPASNNYFLGVNLIEGLPDSLVALISNGDYNASVSSPSQLIGYSYQVLDHAADNFIPLTNLYYYSFDGTNPLSWTVSHFLNNDLLASAPNLILVEYPFPSPFHYSRNTKLYIPLNKGEIYDTYLNVYTSAMELVYSSNERPERNKNGQVLLEWEVKNNNGDKLKTGIYIYAVRVGDETTLGKIVIFND